MYTKQLSLLVYRTNAIHRNDKTPNGPVENFTVKNNINMVFYPNKILTLF